ncbi:MAG: hypothetical protein OXQ31_22765 [Spirochaetaceae bacterium]|nr:hypothetical protein [Spirochaetaceae bacterium]
MPEEIPSDVSRCDFKNYCIGCPECWKTGRSRCYLRYLENNRSTRKTPRSLPCARCGKRIAAGASSCVAVYYEWPETLDPKRTPNAVDELLQFSAPATAVARHFGDQRFDGSFEHLSDHWRAKFHAAGGADPKRTLSEAESLYHDSIPPAVRNLDEDALASYLEGKDPSHILSRRNHPDLAREHRNVIWEDSTANRSRGSRDMTSEELSRAHDANSFQASSIVFRECLDAATTTTLYAGLLETPVAAIENLIHYRKGRKTEETALWDAGRSIAAAASSGAIVGFAVTAAVALLPGAGPLVVTVAPILQTVGLSLYAFNSIKRVLSALHGGLPLTRLIRVGEEKK